MKNKIVIFVLFCLSEGFPRRHLLCCNKCYQFYVMILYTAKKYMYLELCLVYSFQLDINFVHNIQLKILVPVFPLKMYAL